MLRVTVKDGERALLTRNGRLERVLEPGRHRLFDPRRELAAEVLRRGSRRIPRRALRGAERRAARSRGRAVRGGGDEGERDRHRQPRRPSGACCMAPWQVRVYWKVATRVDVERIDVTAILASSARTSR